MTRDHGDWFVEPSPGEGLARSVDILRARWWVVALVAALTLLATLAILPQLQKVYEARASVLVEPVPNSDENLVGLGLPRDSSDPTRNIETVSQLIVTPQVAARVLATLHLKMTQRDLLKHVAAVPVAQSNIVAVTARAATPELAVRLANAFSQSAIVLRTDRLHAELDQMIPRLRAQVAHLSGTEQAAAPTLIAKLQELETLRALPDPTLHVASVAELPRSPVSPRSTLSLAAALLCGAILGVAVVLGKELIDPRLQREDDLRRYRLPVLARVPTRRPGSRSNREGPLLPRASSHAVLEAYQLLAATVAASSGDPESGWSLAVTGPTPAAGKSTTALNLAAALSHLNLRVVLVEGDPRSGLATALGVDPGLGLGAVTTARTPLRKALVDGSRVAPGVRLLLQETNTSTTTVMSGQTVAGLVRDAKSTSDWVVFDSPPPNYVSDGLTIATAVDMVIVVVRLGVTRTRELAELAELFAQQRIEPLGFVVIGSKARTPYLISPSPVQRRPIPLPVSQPGGRLAPDDTHAGTAEV